MIIKNFKKVYFFTFLKIIIRFLPFFKINHEREKLDDSSIIKSINSYKDKIKICFINKKILEISLSQRESIFYWFYLKRITRKEKKLFKLIKTVSKKDSIIVEIGAGLGLMAKSISFNNQLGLIYIEPNTIMFNLLTELNSKKRNSIFIKERIDSYEQFSKLIFSYHGNDQNFMIIGSSILAFLSEPEMFINSLVKQRFDFCFYERKMNWQENINKEFILDTIQDNRLITNLNIKNKLKVLN